MSEGRVRERSEIPEQYTWNAPSLFQSLTAWEDELASLTIDIDRLADYQGHLAESPETLTAVLDLIAELYQRVGKIYTYAGMSSAVNTQDQDAVMALGKARSVYGQFIAAQAFVDPELLEIGKEKLDHWISEEPALAYTAHYIENLFRQQAHVRSAEVEEIMGMLSDPFSSTSETESMLTDADFVFAHAETEEGGMMDVTQGSLQKILADPDRTARRTAWEHYHDEYLAHKNTLAANYITSLKQNVFKMRVRRYTSTLEMALHKDNISPDVFHNLIATFRKNLPTWHRYWALRRKALGVASLHPYDIWAPLVTEPIPVSFEQAVDWISEGLSPMGKDYVRVLRQGALKDRWVDVYPNLGKRAGAFSSGMQGTFPFIMMSFNDNLLSLSTLAHELGHSMHSYLTWENQPFINTNYSLFVAEVASNFHQAMVRSHLLAHHSDPIFQLSLIEEAMSNFHRYFFIMPTLARFELETHQRVEQGRGLNAAGMIDLMADLFSEAYGGEMEIDRERVGITWATFAHIYIDYYVYQYATGISGAHALAERVLSQTSGAVEDYLAFLKAGDSVYPLDALRIAGVNLRTPEAVEVTFDILADMVDRLDKIVG